MKKNIIYTACIVIISFCSCKKESGNDETTEPPVTNAQVLTDFANILGKPNYNDINTRSGLLLQAIDSLAANLNNANLAAARDAWRSVRIPWEQAEGYLFGPAEDYNYDPAIDTWPVNTAELDSLLASSNPLELADIELLQYSLKGYHPIEYILFGVGGSRVPSELTQRHLKYVVSLAKSLFNATTALAGHWDGFAVELSTAGAGSARYATRKDAFLAIVSAMKGICDEVANGKMQTPLELNDSSLVESQYAHNATIDFRNNIVGIENAYFGRYNGVYGKSIHNLVEAKAASLDYSIRTQITASIAALDAIDPNYGLAIFYQQGQILAAQQSLNSLNDLLLLLENFVQTEITD